VIAKEPALERQHRVRRASGEEGAGAFLREPPSRETGRGAEPSEAEAKHLEGVIRKAQRREDVFEERVRLAKERLDQLCVRGPVRPEAEPCLFDRTPEKHRRLVVERMSHRNGRLHPMQAVLLQA